jgi:L-ascorbate metabolism protein UlaG (beta-lactamase superfamily)
MTRMTTTLTYLGGATYLLEIGSFRFLTDPGFDPEGTERSEGPGHDLRKIMAPPVPAEQLGRIDAVLLSHQQHYDNLDITGRALLPKAGRVFTTPESAEALGGNAKGLSTWDTVELTNDAGETIRITGTPAIHGPEELRAAVGETMGFLLEWEGQENGALYISGDTVWSDELGEIARRFNVGTAILHMGAANVPAVGDNILTLSGEQATRLVSALGLKEVFPAHFEGWEHYTEGREGIEAAFAAAAIGDRLNLLDPGERAAVVV